jgi:hypothetical protein
MQFRRRDMPNHKTVITLYVLIILGFVFCSTGFAKDNKEFIPGKDSGFYYTIKKGDTLWDLSEKFYNSQWDWPGLWEMNDDIKNPHWIYPGKKIRIFLREKPALKPKIVEVQKIKKTEKPVEIKTTFSYSQIDHTGFIKKTAQPSLGYIIKEEENNLIMSTNDIIYIKLSGKGKLILGSIYQIFSTENINQKINNQTFEGVKHLIKAKIKILEHKKTYATAVITENYHAVLERDMIMEYHKRDPILTVEDYPDPINAKIICSENNNIIINDYSIAFINIGKASVKPGQIYSIFRKNELSNPTPWPMKKKKNSIELTNLQSGKLIVLHTEDIASTVMILSSSYAIYSNDMVN